MFGGDPRQLRACNENNDFGCIAVLLARSLHGQQAAGKVVQNSITSAALQNSAGESATRRVWVYLPPDYDHSGDRYPVIYYLHGYGSPLILSTNYSRILDIAIDSKRIRPVIFVVPAAVHAVQSKAGEFGHRPFCRGVYWHPYQQDLDRGRQSAEQSAAIF